MSRLHQLVVAASELTDLEVLASILAEACQLVIAEGKSPYKHYAVRFITHQIAFAGDGDYELKQYYKDVLDFCIDNLETEETEGEPSEPTRTPS